MAQQSTQRQIAMVFDLNKCLGCQTCSLACKTHWTDQEGMEYMWWIITNTVPGQGTPKGWQEMGGGYANGQMRPGRIPTREEFGEAWEFNFDEVYYGGKGQSVRLTPTSPDGTAPTWGPNWEEDTGGGEFPNSYFFYLPLTCMHCSRPACAEACPRGAIYKRPQDGIVLINEERCNGCRFCMEACPYKRIYFNQARQVAQKCILCYPRIEQNVAPACARQCPGRMAFVGYLDDEASAVHKLVKRYQVALPLRPDFGTQPNVFYVPPSAPPRFDANGNFDRSSPRIPREYLRNLFGPQVDQALAAIQEGREQARRGQQSELIRTLIAYRFDDLFRPFVQNPAELERPPVR